MWHPAHQARRRGRREEVVPHRQFASEDNITDDIAVADMSYGRGKVIAIGFPAQFRAQPHGTFKLFFNAIHYAKAE